MSFGYLARRLGPCEARMGWWLPVLPTLLVLAPVACIYDADERCGANQLYDDGQCVCADGFGLSGQACVACGENEVSNPTGPCECAQGLIRLGEGEPCTEAVGQPCSSDDECPSADFPYCQLEGESGYCTRQDCTAGGDDCPGEFACNDRGEAPFCERPPTGLGTECTNDDDCDGFEAAYCEVVSEHVCLVEGCAADPDICHGDWVCCDIGLISASLCIPPDELIDGACPVGGTLVPR